MRWRSGTRHLIQSFVMIIVFHSFSEMYFIHCEKCCYEKMLHLMCLQLCLFVKCSQQIPLSCDIIMHISTVVIIIINNCCNCIVLLLGKTYYNVPDRQSSNVFNGDINYKENRTWAFTVRQHLGYSSTLDKPVGPLMCHCVTVWSEVTKLSHSVVS